MASRCGDAKGDAAGIAILRDGNVYVSAISPSGNIGMADDPFLTITMNLPAFVGERRFFSADTFGQRILDRQRAASYRRQFWSVDDWREFFDSWRHPRRWNLSAGTVVRIDGEGFLPNAQLHTKELKISSPKVVSATEIDFTLQQKTTLDGAMIEVQNGSFKQTYYSYLRGVYLRPPSRTILQNSEPVFQQVTHVLASAGPLWDKLPINTWRSRCRIRIRGLRSPH